MRYIDSAIPDMHEMCDLGSIWNRSICVFPFPFLYEKFPKITSLLTSLRKRSGNTTIESTPSHFSSRRQNHNILDSKQTQPIGKSLRPRFNRHLGLGIAIVMLHFNR